MAKGKLINIFFEHNYQLRKIIRAVFKLECVIPPTIKS